jgi:hypothetical protein
VPTSHLMRHSPVHCKTKIEGGRRYERAAGPSCTWPTGTQLTRPDSRVFSAMLEGWRNQQQARNFALATIDARARAAHSLAHQADACVRDWSSEALAGCRTRYAAPAPTSGAENTRQMNTRPHQ